LPACKLPVSLFALYFFLLAACRLMVGGLPTHAIEHGILKQTETTALN
jgi:hypothetical protein